MISASPIHHSPYVLICLVLSTFSALEVFLYLRALAVCSNLRVGQGFGVYGIKALFKSGIRYISAEIWVFGISHFLNFRYTVYCISLTVLAGSGRSGNIDGSETSVSSPQPTAVCCEEGADTVYLLDTSIGRLKIITSTLALTKFLKNLWKLLTAFQMTSDDVSGLEEAITSYHLYPKLLLFP